MSDYVKAGCAAFPVPSYVDAEGYTVNPESGMTLRDWFAGQALAGILAESASGSEEGIASVAYAMADAMLKAREASND